MVLRCAEKIPQFAQPLVSTTVAVFLIALFRLVRASGSAICNAQLVQYQA